MSKKVIWWFLVILWCTFIFSQSGKVAEESGKESMWVVTVANTFITNTFGVDKPVVSETFVRKTAHFLEYLVTGFLLLNAVYNNRKLKKSFYTAFILGAAYAVSDEIHQYFVPGRAMRLLDVMIDSSGVLLGIVLALLMTRRGRRELQQ